MAKRVLNVGQCLADHTGISRMLRTYFDAEVVPADSPDEALEALRQGPFDLVLVNRVLNEGGFLGVDMIRQIKAEEAWRDVPVMLVSNYADAQREAEQVGAVLGFGKGAVGHPQVVERLRQYLG
jgi:CheY-like chemotaxis protein